MTESLYFNRELSWLEFNQRVLAEAMDESNPVLERLKFLAITASNLDEFFMVRVGGLEIMRQRKIARPDISGMTAEEQIAAISARTRRMTEEQYGCFLESIEPKLAGSGIRRVRASEVAPEDNAYLERYFEEEIYPVVSTIGIDPGAEFPLVAGRLLHLLVRFKPREGDEEKTRYAVIPLGRGMNRFVTLPSGLGYTYILLEDVAARFIDRFFPQEVIAECVPFRITRNADFDLQDDDVDDFMSEMEEMIRARRRSDCVRVEIASSATKTASAWLQRNLRVSDSGVYAVPDPLDLSSFMSLSGLGGYAELKNENWPAQMPPGYDPQESIFSTVARAPLLLVHPYDSFDPVIRLIDEAADDPDVLAIKQCLYRTSSRSPIVAALGRAASKGKYVTAVVELKARFDEERNIEWARKLEDDGVHVIYGIRGLKTHAKICVIVRREPQGIVRYVHFGTGNYNEISARIYSDVSFITTDEDLGYDASVFFNTITGNTQPRRFRRIEAAPLGLRDRLLALIDGETARKKDGHKASIMVKVNALIDPQLIDALYRASKAGVKIQLNVRGVCCLRPGVPGVSENISVVSIVDRYLEHARILCFHHGGEEKVFISSADWMPRNLDRRIELLTPVEETHAKRRLVSTLKAYFNDTAKAWVLNQSGGYDRPLPPGSRKKALRSQEFFHRIRVAEAAEEHKRKKAVFEPHRPT